MPIEFETISENCAPRNALFCCRSPVCLNNSPQLVPLTNSAMNSQHQSQHKIYPVCVPNLSDDQLYTNLMIKPTNCDGSDNFDLESTTSIPKSSESSNMYHINKSQSAQDIRHYGVSLRRVTPPKCTISVKKNDTPMMNVVLRKVLVLLKCVQTVSINILFTNLLEYD